MNISDKGQKGGSHEKQFSIGGDLSDAELLSLLNDEGLIELDSGNLVNTENSGKAKEEQYSRGEQQ